MKVLLAIGIFSLVSNESVLIRKQYHAAATDKQQVSLLASTCKQLENNQSSTVLGYCTMVHFLEAKNAFNPYKKFNEFNHGKALLDSLIDLYPFDIELRYMRHSIQDRSPGFLGYKDNLEDDEEFMKSKLPQLTDSAVYQLIYSYLYKPTN